MLDAPEVVVEPVGPFGARVGQRIGDVGAAVPAAAVPVLQLTRPDEAERVALRDGDAGARRQQKARRRAEEALR